MSVRRLPIHPDARGMLVVAEDSDVGFPIRRVFAITGAPAGVMRGEHVVPCRQVIVLVAGAATVWSGASADEVTEDRLEQPGDAVDLDQGAWVRYEMSGPDASVLVCAAAPFAPQKPGPGA
jgi:hypothetical protein